MADGMTRNAVCDTLESAEPRLSDFPFPVRPPDYELMRTPSPWPATLLRPRNSTGFRTPGVLESLPVIVHYCVNTHAHV
jgi:hypothetical protein